MTIVREVISRTSPISRLILHDICKNHKNLTSSGTQLKTLSKIQNPHYSGSQYFVCDNVPKIRLPQLQYSHPINGLWMNQSRILPNLQPTKLRISLPTPILEKAILPSINELTINNNQVETPTENVIEKQAARLIVIRRRKMKKHKLKKLRIRMKFEWAKVRQRREMRKEKKFQAILVSQIKEAEKFDAAKYVAERLERAHELQNPRPWRENDFQNLSSKKN